MSDFDENKFDREIRSLLDGVEEEVPDRVWDALSDRLDHIGKARKRKTALTWLRYSGIAAAAAAVALGVFFGVGDPVRTVVPDSTLAAVEQTDQEKAGDVTAVRSGTDENEPVSTGDIQLQERENVLERAASRPVQTVTSVSSHEPADTETGYGHQEAEPDGGTQSSDTSSEKEESTVTDEARTIEEQIRNSSSDTFIAWNLDDEYAAEETSGKKKIRAALTMSGLASSNSGVSGTGTGSSRPLMSIMRPDQNKEAVTESGGSSSYGIPISFGIGAKIIFTPRWSLGVGINCSMLSRTFSGTYTTYASDNSPVATHYPKIRNTQSYVGIPVNAYFSIVKSKAVDFYAYAGGTAEKCVANRYRMGEGDIIYNEKVRGFQFSANAGLGVEFIIADMLGIYIDPSLRYYFPDSRQPKSIRTVQPLTLGFEMGFRVRL